ncbi:hypothetical protein GE061_005947, partial [Apolygus lucorum]
TCDLSQIRGIPSEVCWTDVLSKEIVCPGRGKPRLGQEVEWNETFPSNESQCRKST